MKVFFRSLLLFTIILIAVCFIIFTPLDRSHYEGTTYHQQTMSFLDGISLPGSPKDALNVGWAKENITPRAPVSIASYGLRNDFKAVHDSLWCRAFVFENAYKKTALVTLDLLIFPPVVVKKLKESLPQIGFTLENVFLSTSHTHNGAGGWAEGWGGWAVAGKYNEVYVNQIVEAILLAIEKASHSKEPAGVGFGKYDASEYVFNRLTQEKSALDHWLRVIKIQKKSGETAAVVSYAGHANILSSSIDELSGDYAGALVDSLENVQGIDFAAFCAGAVGSHTCRMDEEKNYDLIRTIAAGLTAKIKKDFEAISLDHSVRLSSLFVPVHLRKPQLKILKDIALRPWVFDYLFKKQDVYIMGMRLGNIMLIGTPCDFSGELVKEFDVETSKKDMNLMITSFNGGYIGYIIPDRYYDISRREAKEMNWYGPYSGSYFVEIIKKVLDKF